MKIQSFVTEGKENVVHKIQQRERKKILYVSEREKETKQIVTLKDLKRFGRKEGES